MKRISIAIAFALLIAAAGVTSAQTVVGTSHDLRSLTGQDEVCVSCHTPHLPTGQTTLPLWNHTESTQTYTPYASGGTMQSTPTGPANDSISGLCLSCHDATVAVGSYYNGPTAVYTTVGWNVDATGIMTGNAAVGTDLSNDHPVNMDYTTAGPGLKPEGSVTVPLFGSFVQCASCHDAHDSQFGSFLTMDNSGSALCLDCHLK